MDMESLEMDPIKDRVPEPKRDNMGADFSSEGNEKPAFKIEKEQAHEVSSSERDDAYAKIVSRIKGGTSNYSDEEVSTDARDMSLEMDAQSQVQRLVELASLKGVAHAVKVARHIEDNYILDSFHDKLLSDELHTALLEKGIIEDV